MKEGLNQFKMYVSESPEVINNVTMMKKLGESIYGTSKDRALPKYGVDELHFLKN